MVIYLILEPIKRDFHLSDSALGLLTGLGYAVPFAIAGLPLGALADRTNRKRMLAVLISTWSVLTAMGGLARGFGTLLTSRMAVGAAESATPPILLALVSDYFPPRLRATATSILYVGAPLGAVLAAQAGGHITAAYGWRATLMVAAIPGLLLSLLILLTVKEPIRGGMEADQATTPTDEAPPPFKAVFALIWRKPALALIIGGLVFSALSTVGISTWIPALLMRDYNMPVKDAGGLVALSGLVGIGGTLLGGVIADIYAKGHTRRLLILAGLANVLQPIPLLMCLAAPSVEAFKAPFFIWTILHTVYYGAGFSLAVSLAPPRMRARLMAVTFVLANILGAGLGPQIIGLLSDAFSRAGDPQALPHAVGSLGIAVATAGILFLLALRFAPKGVVKAMSMDDPAN